MMSLKGLLTAASTGQIPVRPATASLCAKAPSMAACASAPAPLLTAAADHSGLARVALGSGAAAAQRPMECCHVAAPSSHVALRVGPAAGAVATASGRDPGLRGLRFQGTSISGSPLAHHHCGTHTPLLRASPGSALPPSSCSRGIPPLRCSLPSHASLSSQAHPACPPASAGGASPAASPASTGLGGSLPPQGPGFASLASGAVPAASASPSAGSPGVAAAAAARAGAVVFRHMESATDELLIDGDEAPASTASTQEGRRGRARGGQEGEGSNSNGAASSSLHDPYFSHGAADSAASGGGAGASSSASTSAREKRESKARGRFRNSLEPNPMTQEAWELLQASTVYYCNQPVGTVAASDPTDTSPLNYDQVFIRDFIPSALAFMLSGQSEIVRNFLLYTLQLQSWEKTVDCHRPGEGLMPASFKVTQVPVEGGEFGEYEEHLDPDFGESAIGRVAPVDSGLWWIQLLRAYGRCTGDYSLQQRLDVQTGIKLILKICLADHFDMFPTLITTDGSCMIDRRLGIHGHPLEIQSLLYGALRAAKEMILPENGGLELIRTVDARLTALSFHIRQYYWLDQRKLNEIYRYKTEEYSYEAVNKFNIYPDQIPSWLMDWIPDRGGYFLGNVQPAHMDFRFFSLGNMWAIVSALASPQQAEGVLDLVEERWDELVGHMPLKIVYPALEKEEWRIITGADPKNTPWSYHNGGSWPVLLWQFTAACIKMGRPHLAQKAVELAERRLQLDRWPEYYDTKSGRFIGKQARLHQTWSIAGYLASKLLLANPEAVWLFAIEEDHGIAEATSSFLCGNTGTRRRRFKATVPLSMMP